MSDRPIIPMPNAEDRKRRDVAIEHGCKPTWYDGILGWRYHCTCEEETHCGDQQCSVITAASAIRTEPRR